MGFVSVELLVIFCGLCIFMIVLFEVFSWKKSFFNDNDMAYFYSYNYDCPVGPLAWKDKFPQSKGCMQSPVNITLRDVIVIPLNTTKPLCFSAEYNQLPIDFRAYNDGHTVRLYARWENDLRPVIEGGPLRDKFRFFNACFRWGPTDEEGSEHIIDSLQYSMELQVVHLKVGENYVNMKQAAENNAVLIVSYLFQVTPIENVFLRPIVNILEHIKNPSKCVSLELFPLSCIMPQFMRNYLLYCGSLTYPPCTEGVYWIIQLEPLGISSSQLQKFREIRSYNGSTIDINTRPIQLLNTREVVLYE